MSIIDRALDPIRLFFAKIVARKVVQGLARLIEEAKIDQARLAARNN